VNAVGILIYFVELSGSGVFHLSGIEGLVAVFVVRGNDIRRGKSG
jgi:hypothetical protein